MTPVRANKFIAISNLTLYGRLFALCLIILFSLTSCGINEFPTSHLPKSTIIFSPTPSPLSNSETLTLPPLIFPDIIEDLNLSSSFDHDMLGCRYSIRYPESWQMEAQNLPNFTIFSFESSENAALAPCLSISFSSSDLQSIYPPNDSESKTSEKLSCYNQWAHAKTLNPSRTTDLFESTVGNTIVPGFSCYNFITELWEVNLFLDSPEQNGYFHIYYRYTTETQHAIIRTILNSLCFI